MIAQRVYSVVLEEVDEGTVIQSGADRFVVAGDMAVFANGRCYLAPANYRRVTGGIDRAEREKP